MKRIGIFGGTFNPIHTGHLIIAQEALRKLGLDKVIFVPAYIPPHKKSHDLANAADRYQMVKLAIKNNPRFEVSLSEIKRKGKSYSIDTINEFKAKFAKAVELFFIIGSDTLSELKEWKEIDKIKKLIKFVVLNRPAYPIKSLGKDIKKIETPLINISSSRIRSLIHNDESFQYLVPDSVMQYIKKNNLYR